MRSSKAMAAKQGAPHCREGVRRLLRLLCAAGLVAAFGVTGRAQQPQLGTPNSIGNGLSQPGGPFGTGGDEVDTVQAERRLNALNAERQKSLTADAEKLLKLAAELNQEIAQSNPGALTPAQLRMVAEIEKLAHNVRDKMAMSLRGPQFPGLDQPLQSFPQPEHH